MVERPSTPRSCSSERFDPWSLYRLKTTGQRVTIYGFSENPEGIVTVTVRITGKYNLTDFDKIVFGIDPNDLEPCDPPPADEPVGTMLKTKVEIDEYVSNILRTH